MNTELLTITNLIVALTCLISWQLMQNRNGKSQLIFHPVTIKEHNQWYRFLTSGFIHADWWHLGVNMFVLWSFGNAVENYLYPHFLGEFSTLKYMALYFGGIIVSSIPSFFRYQNAPHYAALGASGGVSAVVFAVILFEPWQKLYGRGLGLLFHYIDEYRLTTTIHPKGNGRAELVAKNIHSNRTRI